MGDESPKREKKYEAEGSGKAQANQVKGTTMTTTILKATSSADFLAAFPRIAGMRAPESCWIVLFDGNRTLGAARLDLATPEMQHDYPAMIGWAREIRKIAKSADRAALIFETAAELTENPASSYLGRLASLVTACPKKEIGNLVDVLIVGSDGWASMYHDRFTPALHSLTEITASPLYEPELTLPDVDAWRAQHPGCTTDDETERQKILDRMLA